MLKKLIAVSPDPLRWLKQIKYVGTEETPYKIDRSVKIIDKKQYSQNMVKKNRSGLCTAIPAHAIIRIIAIGV